MQIHQSFIKAAQKGVFHGDGLLECTSSGVSLGYGWLPCRALGYWKVTYATKRRVMLDFGQTLSLAAWKRMKPPPRPRHHHPRKWSEKGWHLLHSPSLFWSSKKKTLCRNKIQLWPYQKLEYGPPEGCRSQEQLFNTTWPPGNES